MEEKIVKIEANWERVFVGFVLILVPFGVYMLLAQYLNLNTAFLSMNLVLFIAFTVFFILFINLHRVFSTPITTIGLLISFGGLIIFLMGILAYPERITGIYDFISEFLSSRIELGLSLLGMYLMMLYFIIAHSIRDCKVYWYLRLRYLYHNHLRYQCMIRDKAKKEG